jgi:hypothetical protein
MIGHSETPTPYAVRCLGLLEGYECLDGGLVFLTKEAYNHELMLPDRTWRCPLCGDD